MRPVLIGLLVTLLATFVVPHDAQPVAEGKVHPGEPLPPVSTIADFGGIISDYEADGDFLYTTELARLRVLSYAEPFNPRPTGETLLDVNLEFHAGSRQLLALTPPATRSTFR